MRTRAEKDAQREKVRKDDNTVDAILELCRTIDEAVRNLVEALAPGIDRELR